MHPRTILAGLILCFCFEMSHAAVTVGTCQSDKHPYTTISAAIAAVPAGGVVNVCPGTYAEQLEIDTPLTIQGIVIAGQPGVTIVFPTTGLNQLPANSGFYPQVFVNNAGGPVKLINLSVSGGGGINYPGFAPDASINLICQGTFVNYAGVYFLSTPGLLDHMNVSGQYASTSLPDDEGPQFYPYCGSGIEFHGSEKAVVSNSVVSHVGLYGIYSDGDLTADHNVVSGGSGPQGVGIAAGSGTITDNAVTGSLSFFNTIGIHGGELVKGNVVQSAIYGIVGASKIRHNTLLNNAISLSEVTDASDNLISAPSTYYNPACFYGGGSACNSNPPLGPPFPTIGIDFGCADGSHVLNNGIVGVGIGIANVEIGQTFSPTNLFANVTTTSMSCTH